MNASAEAELMRPMPNTRLLGWREHLVALGAVWLGLLLLFRGDAADIVRIWWTSSTYAHCMLIPIVISWLVAQRIDGLRLMIARGWWGGLPIVAAGAACWLLGSLASAAVLRHLGLAIMLQGSVVAILGPAVARGLLFPLAYILFLVPAGDVLVPPLQTITAKMCMALLGLFGVPAHIEGVFIWIPNGYFEVAEACSGAKFLIAMLAYGVLVAHVCFRSWPRRIAFLALATSVPILANGLRAFGTIYVAHLTTADAAAGFDHVVYGWIFFGFVIIAVMAIGWRFFDRSIDDPWFDPAQLGSRSGRSADLILAVGGTLGLAIAVLAWSAASDGAGVRLALSLPTVPGWTVAPAAPVVPWQPHYVGADAVAVRHYVGPRGVGVDLGAAVFASQAEGHDLVGFGQGATAPGGKWAWANDTMPPTDGRGFRISAPGAMREVALFYVIAGHVTGSENEVKLLTLRQRLLGRSTQATAILVSAEGGQARAAIAAFLTAAGPIDALAATIARPAALP